MKNKNLVVTKMSGEQDVYAPEKLRYSLAKAGANQSQIDAILAHIETRLFNGISTRKIYQLAFRLLKKIGNVHASRYDLKRAIMQLGPSGFPFEQYIASIFAWQGYGVKTKLFLPGACVTHEIDVLAENEKEALLIECKYHNKQGLFSDVKIPLYIHSRYQDVLKKWNESLANKPLIGWLVTNTKFSADAIQYGTCAGLHLLGWNFPSHKSLSSLVDKSGLYPVTCLTTLNNKEKEQILAAQVVLAKDLQQKQSLLQQIGISSTRIAKILAEVDGLCKP
jgi:Holliday junction resolvase